MTTDDIPGEIDGIPLGNVGSIMRQFFEFIPDGVGSAMRSQMFFSEDPFNGYFGEEDEYRQWEIL